MARKPRQPNAMLAAATRVNMRDPASAKQQMAPAREWHVEAWGYFDGIPEIKESVRYRGNQLGKLRLYCAVANPTDPDGDPVPVSDPTSGVPATVAAAADAELARLRSALGGQGEILRMLDMNLEVAGECYLVGYAPREVDVPGPNGTTVKVTEPENWVIRSVSEVQVQGSGPSQKYLVRRDEGDRGTPLDKETDDIIRVWTRHPQWSEQPDSAMRGLLADCRILQVLNQQLLAHTYRSLSAGLFTVPNELSFGPANPTLPEGPAGDPLHAALDQVLGGPVEDPSDPHTVQPGILRGPAEFLQEQYLRRIKFYDPEVVEGIERRIQARVERVARGLNLPVEKVMGHQQTTYANAEQVDEDEFNDYLAPSADTATDALTFAFLAPNLRALQLPDPWPDTIFVWYDASDLISQPDTEKHATEAWDRGAIGDAALRSALGFSEDDAPAPLELLQRAGLRRGILTAELTLALLNLLGVPIELPEGPVEEGGGQVPAPEEATAELLAQAMAMLSASGTCPSCGVVQGQTFVAANHLPACARRRPALRAASAPAPSDHGRRLVELDRELRANVLAAADTAMARALERAGNVLRSRTNGGPLRATLDAAPRHRWFAQLGPTLVAEALGDTDPLAGAWDDLGRLYAQWGAQAQAEALRIAGLATGADLADLSPRQADDLADAWAWLADALTTEANSLLWNPDPAAPPLGEFDPNRRVPAGMVRQALARAGGAVGLVTSGTDAWVTLTDGGQRPAGGIGTGELVRGALRDNGAGVEAYRWVYGPAFRQRPFEPHQQLDGVVFDNFDSAVLANRSGWPFTAFYLPGDHAGCICDFEPIIIPAARAA